MSSAGGQQSGSLRISFLCPGSQVFGLERMALALIRGLNERGHELACIINAWNDGDFASRLKALGIPTTEVHLGKLSRTVRWPYVWWNINTLIHLPAARKKCRVHFETFNPDVVICYDGDWVVLNDSAIERYATAFHVHDLPLSGGASASMFKAWRFRKLNGRISIFIAVSESVRRRLQEVGIVPEKTRLIYNGIPPAQPRSRSNKSATSVIGILGQVAEWKGHDDLIEALAIMHQQGENFRCVIVGSGKPRYVRSLQEKVQRYGLVDKVVWHGYVSDTDRIFQEIDICVAPSRVAETFGLVAAEAGLRGLPVVATRCGALPEIVIDGVTGLLVDSRSPGGLADRLSRLLRDPQLRNKLGDAARQRVMAEFVEERMIDNLEALCRELASHYPLRASPRASVEVLDDIPRGRALT